MGNAMSSTDGEGWWPGSAEVRAASAYHSPRFAFPLFLNKLDAESMEEVSSTKVVVMDFQEIDQMGHN